MRAVLIAQHVRAGRGAGEQLRALRARLGSRLQCGLQPALRVAVSAGDLPELPHRQREAGEQRPIAVLVRERQRSGDVEVFGRNAAEPRHLLRSTELARGVYDEREEEVAVLAARVVKLASLIKRSDGERPHGVEHPVPSLRRCGEFDEGMIDQPADHTGGRRRR